MKIRGWLLLFLTFCLAVPATAAKRKIVPVPAWSEVGGSRWGELELGHGDHQVEGSNVAGPTGRGCSTTCGSVYVWSSIGRGGAGRGGRGSDGDMAPPSGTAVTARPPAGNAAVTTSGNR